MDIEEKKKLASSWLRELRDSFCKEFEAIDGSKFERKHWDHKFSGGGEMSIMTVSYTHLTLPTNREV